MCDGKSTRILRPYGDKVESYLWTAVSPDGSKIVTYAIGVGTVVLDMQGNILAELGDYESPTWYGNDFVAAMKATDDGHQFTSSKIVLLDCNSKQVHDLTSPSEMGMNPSLGRSRQNSVQHGRRKTFYVGIECNEITSSP